MNHNDFREQKYAAQANAVPSSAGALAAAARQQQGVIKERFDLNKQHELNIMLEDRLSEMSTRLDTLESFCDGWNDAEVPENVPPEQPKCWGALERNVREAEILVNMSEKILSKLGRLQRILGCSDEE